MGRPPVDLDRLEQDVLANRRAGLAKAITLVESTRDDHREQAQQLLLRLLSPLQLDPREVLRLDYVFIMNLYLGDVLYILVYLLHFDETFWSKCEEKGLHNKFFEHYL